MKDAELLSLMISWNYWDGKKFPSLVERHEVKSLEHFLSGTLTVIIKGPRRSGKSSLMKIMYKRISKDIGDPISCFFINLEDFALAEEKLDTSLLERMYRIYRQHIRPIGKIYMFLDEVQNIKGWEKWVKTYREKEEIKFFISGSSSKLGSKELSTLLTGRHVDLTLFPFSFESFIKANGFKFNSWIEAESRKDEIKHLLFKYFEIGGFPEIVLNYPKEGKTRVLETYFNDIIYRDIVERWKIRDALLLKRIAFFLLKNAGNLISYRKIQGMLKEIAGTVSTNTISEHVSHLVESYMIFETQKFTNSLKNMIRSPKKIFSIDTGFRKAVTKSVTNDYGRDAENVVFLELIRRGYEVNYWQDDKTEIDFIARKNDKTFAINVTASNLEEPSLEKRELKSLVQFPYPSNLLLLTNDLEEEKTIAGKKIKLFPIWKWLLNFHSSIMT